LNNKKRLILKFTLMVGSAVAVFLAVTAVTLVIFKASVEPIPQQYFSNETKNEDVIIIKAHDGETELPTEEKPDVPDKTNFLIAGLDNTNDLTDVIMVGSFDSRSKMFEIINIPRDTKVNFNGIITKINAIYNRRDGGIDVFKSEIEDLLNIKLDYYVLLNTEAFGKIVDAVDGIEYTLERDYYYFDPDQDLLIDLKAGEKVLNGSEAEQFVRFRDDYRNGDLDRIKVQQDFLKEMFRQVLRKETILENPLGFAKIFLTYVKTDFGITDAAKYVKFINSISGENIRFTTLPGESGNDPDDGTSYFYPYNKEVTDLITRVFYYDYTEEEFAQFNSKDLKINILNGSNTNGIASKVRDQLKASGYNNVEIGSYTGEKQKQTRINVKDQTRGKDLQQLLKTPILQVDENMKDFDIIIILGTNY